MDKKQRQKLKKQFKKQLTNIVGDSVACSAKYYEDNQSWEVWLLNEYDIPPGLEVVKVNIDEDAKQEAVVTFMKQKEEELIRKLSKYFNIENKAQNIQDFNFTVTFPPMYSTTYKDGVFRLKTKEEKEAILKEYPHFAENFEYDDKIFREGHYEFAGAEGPPENDGFILKKYAGLKALYHFILTKKNEQEKKDVV